MKKQRRAARRRRPRTLQQPNALAFTIPGFQALGGCGKTSVYHLAKKGVLQIFKDPLGRTLITGASARAYLSVKEEDAAA